MSGYLDQGTWRPGWYDTRATAGEFVRPDAGFRGRLEPGAIQAQPGRYHLVVSLACPWAHRTIIFRALKALQGALPLVVVDPVMGAHGWVFSEEYPSPLAGSTCLHELYTAAQPDYSGR
jgi:glutathionyl-hydroquinone reductase